MVGDWVYNDPPPISKQLGERTGIAPNTHTQKNDECWRVWAANYRGSLSTGCLYVSKWFISPHIYAINTYVFKIKK